MTLYARQVCLHHYKEKYTVSFNIYSFVHQAPWQEWMPDQHKQQLDTITLWVWKSKMMFNDILYIYELALLCLTAPWFNPDLRIVLPAFLVPQFPPTLPQTGQ